MDGEKKLEEISKMLFGLIKNMNWHTVATFVRSGYI
jgi:hypothetical protein